MQIGNVEVLNTKPGDIVWIELKSESDTTDEQLIRFVESLHAILPKSVTPIITFDNMVSGLRMSTIDEIREVRDSLDQMIADIQLTQEYGD